MGAQCWSNKELKWKIIGKVVRLQGNVIKKTKGYKRHVSNLYLANFRSERKQQSAPLRHSTFMRVLSIK